MRVTAKTKEATRKRLLKVAEELFGSNGFQATTSRDLAAGVGIAAGTIFNYFASKEAIALQLIADRLDGVEAAFERRTRGEDTLEEDVFLFISTGLRQLASLRTFIAPVLETHFGPASDDSLATGIRAAHLEYVGSLLQKHGHPDPLNGTQSQMYWLLYTGVLAFWAKDTSRRQEDTLALLDQSVKMFVTWITAS